MTHKPPTSAQARPPRFSRSSTICPLSLRGRICCSAARGPARWPKLQRQGKPAIFVPFPRAADDHQRVNAQALERAGAAVVLEETKLDEVWLVETVSNLLGDSSRLRRMSEAARSLAHPERSEGHCERWQRSWRETRTSRGLRGSSRLNENQPRICTDSHR